MFCKNCGKESNIDQKFCINCGNVIFAEKTKRLLSPKRLILITSFVILIVLLITIYLFIKSKNISPTVLNKEISSIVVNIYCESDLSEYASGGSGTIWTEDGLVITNAHIIPTDDLTGETDVNSSCLVTLPNPETGQPDEIYWAYPIIIPDLSEDYDIAFVQIDDVYYDDEENIYYGDYPKKFPYYIDDKKCSKDYVKLGEPVRVYGYPSISGGYSLTITDGIISSLLIDEGLIVTSAKISHGNSGGLAVDENECMLGIPTYFMGDEGESLGMIVSNDFINNFIDEVNAFIENNN